jgi:heat shock protein HslJ
MRRTALVGLGCVLLASCASTPSESPDGGTSAPSAREPVEEPRPSIEGRWLVVAVEQGGERLDAPAGAGDDAVSIEFAGAEGARSRVSGYGGVNRFSGNYSHSPGEMLVGAMWVADTISTKRAGPPEAMRFESAFLDVLGRARSFVFGANDGLNAVIEAGGDRVILRRR